MNTIFASLEQIANKTSQFCKRINYPQKVAFMHIPKCAGSSIMESLRQNNKASWAGHIDGPKTRYDYTYYFRENSNIESILEFEKEVYKYRQILLIDRFQKNHPIISGHIPFLHCLKSSYPDYFFFTVIREPISRFLSAFNFSLRKGNLGTINLKLVEEKGIDYAFEKYLDLERSILEGSLLSIFLAECGKEEIELNNIEKKAYRGIDIFDCIVTSEKIDLLSEELKKRKIIKSKIGRYNVTNKAKNRFAMKTQTNLSNLQKNKLEERCYLDSKIYAFIINKSSL